MRILATSVAEASRIMCSSFKNTKNMHGWKRIFEGQRYSQSTSNLRRSTFLPKDKTRIPLPFPFYLISYPWLELFSSFTPAIPYSSPPFFSIIYFRLPTLSLSTKIFGFIKKLRVFKYRERETLCEITHPTQNYNQNPIN